MKQKHRTRVRLCEARSFPWGNAELFRKSSPVAGTTVDDATDGVCLGLDAHRGSASRGRVPRNPNRPCRQPPGTTTFVLKVSELRRGEARFQNALSPASRKSMRHWKI